MKLYFSTTHSDEEGGFTEEGKIGIIYSSKEKKFKLTKFFREVSNHLKENNTCHMQFRDSCEEWDKENFIDVEVNVE